MANITEYLRRKIQERIDTGFDNHLVCIPPGLIDPKTGCTVTVRKLRSSMALLAKEFNVKYTTTQDTGFLLEIRFSSKKTCKPFKLDLLG